MQMFVTPQPKEPGLHLHLDQMGVQWKALAALYRAITKYIRFLAPAGWQGQWHNKTQWQLFQLISPSLTPSSHSPSRKHSGSNTCSLLPCAFATANINKRKLLHSDLMCQGFPTPARTPDQVASRTQQLAVRLCSSILPGHLLSPHLAPPFYCHHMQKAVRTQLVFPWHSRYFLGGVSFTYYGESHKA